MFFHILGGPGYGKTQKLGNTYFLRLGNLYENWQFFGVCAFSASRGLLATNFISNWTEVVNQNREWS